MADDAHLLVNSATANGDAGQLLRVTAGEPTEAATMEIGVPDASTPGRVVLAPDRTKLMVVGAGNEVSVAAFATGDASLAYEGSAGVVTADWSPDSSALAILTGTGEAYGGGHEQYELAVHELATGDRRVVWTGRAYGDGLAWSPDSSQLAISGEAGTETGLWIVSRDGSNQQRVSDIRLLGMSWQPGSP